MKEILAKVQALQMESQVYNFSITFRQSKTCIGIDVSIIPERNADCEIFSFYSFFDKEIDDVMNRLQEFLKKHAHTQK